MLNDARSMVSMNVEQSSAIESTLILLGPYASTVFVDGDAFPAGFFANYLIPGHDAWYGQAAN